MRNFLAKFFKTNTNLDKSEVKLEAQVHEKVEPAEKVHDPLLKKLKKFKKHTLNSGAIIFHGSREFSLHTDYENRSLSGSRKWLSEDIEYAVNYAFYFATPQQGRPLLWMCKIKSDLECLKGSQDSLTHFSPWAGEFAYKFPNNFSKYATEIQGEKESYGLVDLLKNGKFKEILISPHKEILEVVDVLVLPNDKAKAKEVALNYINNG